MTQQRTMTAHSRALRTRRAPALHSITEFRTATTTTEGKSTASTCPARGDSRTTNSVAVTDVLNLEGNPGGKHGALWSLNHALLSWSLIRIPLIISISKIGAHSSTPTYLAKRKVSSRTSPASVLHNKN
ncbi:hypothetical protein EVAR_7810_1 [Eumeta japonica]|uniref:Uncharacterized protein n=1 Tax=Eumeta variegata TaxID=151549 RepID=A0A4C1TJ78_EUMVA|nr:hypothetical protein EVAR_7810_1 [Eumeta japonica]